MPNLCEDFMNLNVEFVSPRGWYQALGTPLEQAVINQITKAGQGIAHRGLGHAEAF
jgi:hypothetical protein